MCSWGSCTIWTLLHHPALLSWHKAAIDSTEANRCGCAQCHLVHRNELQALVLQNWSQFLSGNMLKNSPSIGTLVELLCEEAQRNLGNKVFACELQSWENLGYLWIVASKVPQHPGIPVTSVVPASWFLPGPSSSLLCLLNVILFLNGDDQSHGFTSYLVLSTQPFSHSCLPF